MWDVFSRTVIRQPQFRVLVEPLEERILFSSETSNIALIGAVQTIVAQAIAPNHDVLIAGDDMGQLRGTHGSHGGTPDEGFVAAMTTSGGLDDSFGRGGILRISNPTSAADNYITSMTLIDDKILIETSDDVVREFNSNGTINRSFGSNGSIKFRGVNGVMAAASDGNSFYIGQSIENTKFDLIHISSSGQVLHSAAVECGSLGDIAEISVNGNEVALFATCSQPQTLPAGAIPSTSLGVALFNASAEPLTGFGNGGEITFGYGNNNWPNGIAIVAAGRIVTSAQTGAQQDLDGPITSKNIVSEINTNGHFNRRFGTRGEVDTATVREAELYESGPNLLAVDGYGCIDVAEVGLNGQRQWVEIINRFLPNGMLDSTFGTDGTETQSVTRNYVIWSVFTNESGDDVETTCNIFAGSGVQNLGSGGNGQLLLQQFQEEPSFFIPS